MKKRTLRNFGIAMGLLATFVLWTIAICWIDVQAIGPMASTVGFATLNGFLHNVTGVHMLLYTITDWLGLVPLCFCLGFAILGLSQLIKRKSLQRVDKNILVLGGFYVVVIAAYLLFEVVAVNYRPVLIAGKLEASYPSSTTLLVLSVMSTVLIQLNHRMKESRLKKIVLCSISVFLVFMVVGRWISGVHWFTDIVGSILLSAGLVLLYGAITTFISCKEDKKAERMQH